MTEAGRPMRLENPWLIAAGLFLFALALRLIGLNRDPLWTDEAITIELARATWDSLLGYLLYDASPPGSYLVFRAWMALGAQPEQVRYLAALAGALTAPVVYFLGCRLFYKRVGLVAALLFSINPFHLYYSQEIRYPVLLTLAAALQMLAFIRLIDRRTWPDAVYLALATAAGCWLQYFFYFVIFAEALWVIILARKPTTTLFSVFASLTAGLLAAGPTLALLSFQLAKGKPDRVFVSIPKALGLAVLFPTLGGSEFNLPHLTLLGGLSPQEGGWTYLLVGFALSAPFLLLIWLGLAADRSNGDRRWMGAFLALIPVLMLLIFSRFWPIFRPKYLLPVLPIFACLAAAGAFYGNVGRVKRIGAVTGLLVFTLSVVALINQYTDPFCRRENWTAVTNAIESAKKPGDAIVTANRYHSLGFVFSYHGSLPVFSYASDTPYSQPCVKERLERRLGRLAARHDRFWVVGHKSAQFDPKGLLENYAGKHWRLVSRRQAVFPGHDVPLALYAVNDAARDRSFSSEIDFAGGDFASGQLVDGFLDARDGGYRWMGQSAVVRVKGTGHQPTAFACLYVHRPYFGDHDPTASLFVDGREIARQRIAQSGQVRVQGRVGKEGSSNDLHEIKVQFDRTFVPNDVRHDGDRREKTALVQRIGLADSTTEGGNACVLP